MSLLLREPLLLYLIRMTLVSAVLLGYYRFFLRDTSSHTYNRWYLLLSLPLAFLLPLLHFHFPWAPLADPPHFWARVLWEGKTGATAATANPGGNPGDGFRLFQISHRMIPGIYTSISLILFFGLARSVFQLVKKTRKYPVHRLGPVFLLETGEMGAPFSFLHWLFWDAGLDRKEGHGRLIFRHESYHITQRHTLDVLFLSLGKCIGWINPFFYWTLRELKVLHEFMADRYALSSEEEAGEKKIPLRQEYAELLLWQSVRGRQPSRITHSFFQNQLKRRITMITTIKIPKARRMAKIMIGPLFILLSGVFATGASSLPHPASHSMDSTEKKALLKFYCKRLLYPGQAIQANQEANLWFSIRVENGKLKEYKTYDVKPEGKEFLLISINAYKGTPNSTSLSTGKALDPFREEGRRVSKKIGTDEKASSVAPGDYYFNISWRLEDRK